MIELVKPRIEAGSGTKGSGQNVVIFGASGDLARRKILPALGRLSSSRALRVVGAGRSDVSPEQFRNLVASASRSTALGDSSAWVRLDYQSAEGYKHLQELLDSDGRPTVFYLATPPAVVSPILTSLSTSGLLRRQDGNRIVVEKPLGRDAATAAVLNQQLASIADESQVYRIDHYLGKDTVQNLLAFRFGNPIFEAVWNRNFIASIQITAAEEIDIVERAGYYDEVGAVRDMVQNHLLQILALVAMEPPGSLDAVDIRAAKYALLRAVRPLDPSAAVAGQYDGYRSADGVPGDSRRETYAAAKISIDNWRWQDVPIFLRTGKAMARQVTEVIVRLKPAAALRVGGRTLDPIATVLALCIQPNEGIVLRLGAKRPGPEFAFVPAGLRLDYSSLADHRLPEAYENVLGEILSGAQGTFPGPEEIVRSWQIVDPLLREWESNGHPVTYARGSWGPSAADDLISTNGGERWLNGSDTVFAEVQQ